MSRGYGGSSYGGSSPYYPTYHYMGPYSSSGTRYGFFTFYKDEINAYALTEQFSLNTYLYNLMSVDQKLHF